MNALSGQLFKSRAPMGGYSSETLDAAKKRKRSFQQGYGKFAVSGNSLMEAQDDYALARASGASDGELADMQQKAQGMAMSNEAVQTAQAQKLQDDAQTAVNPPMPAAPPQGQFFQKRRMR